MKQPSLDMVKLAWAYIYAHAEEFNAFVAMKTSHNIDTSKCADRLHEELNAVEKVMVTNFAACMDKDIGTLVCAVDARFNPHTEGSGTLIQHICQWLFAPSLRLKECVAPTYVSCDLAIYKEAMKCNICTKPDCEVACPFAKVMGRFV